MLVGLVAPSARAQQADLAVFGANAVAQGVQVTGGPEPFILSPVVNVSAPFVRTTLNSTPDSNVVASALYPGDTVSAVLGSNYPLNLYADAANPKAQDQTKSVVGLPTDQAGLAADAIYLHAAAKPTENTGIAAAQRLVLQPAGQKTPLVSIGSM
jgi:hypothetical protein